MNLRRGPNKKQLALVHVAKADLMRKGALMEEDYRALLAHYGDGAASSKDLSQGQLDELLQHFERCGFVPRARPPKVAGAPEIRRLARARQAHLGLIETTLAALGMPWAYAEGIARKMFGIRKLEWLKPEQLGKVQAALVYREKKVQGSGFKV